MSTQPFPFYLRIGCTNHSLMRPDQVVPTAQESNNRPVILGSQV